MCQCGCLIKHCGSTLRRTNRKACPEATGGGQGKMSMAFPDLPGFQCPRIWLRRWRDVRSAQVFFVLAIGYVVLASSR